MESTPTSLEDMALTFTNHRILVTGATGFVGSHLVEKLIQLGNQIYCTSISHQPLSYFYTQKLDQQSVVLNVDVTEFEKVKDVVSKFSIDYIFHLASQPLVDVAYLNPRRTLESNIMGT